MDQELINRIVREVRNSIQGGSVVNTANGRTPSSLEDQAPEKIFVTADALAARLGTGGHSSELELAENEFLTPAAEDLVQRRRIGITRINKSRPLPAGNFVTAQKRVPSFSDVPLSQSRDSNSGVQVGLVTYLEDQKTDSVLKALAHDGIFFIDGTIDECWMVNLLNLCEGITGGSLSLGVALFPFAADALILANKVQGIRAVQGTRTESVAASIRRLDTNLLILEHRLSTFYELRAMTRIFVQGRMVAGLADDVIGKIESTERK